MRTVQEASDQKAVGVEDPRAASGDEDRRAVKLTGMQARAVHLSERIASAIVHERCASSQIALRAAVGIT
jgi:hypothetical protein